MVRSSLGQSGCPKKLMVKASRIQKPQKSRVDCKDPRIVSFPGGGLMRTAILASMLYDLVMCPHRGVVRFARREHRRASGSRALSRRGAARFAAHNLDSERLSERHECFDLRRGPRPYREGANALSRPDRAHSGSTRSCNARSTAELWRLVSGHIDRDDQRSDFLRRLQS
jgi:hypothetical protein